MACSSIFVWYRPLLRMDILLRNEPPLLRMDILLRKELPFLGMDILLRKELTGMASVPSRGAERSCRGE